MGKCCYSMVNNSLSPIFPQQMPIVLSIVRLVIHYGLHLVFPLVIARFFYINKWKQSYLILLTTMLVDMDHLWASPIFDPNRCSINFHPLHTYYAIGFYVMLLFFKKTRLIGIGLTLHMFTDFLDCLWI